MSKVSPELVGTVKNVPEESKARKSNREENRISVKLGIMFWTD
jgi:hypothetical protein